MAGQGNDGAFRARHASEQHFVERFDTLDEAVKEAERRARRVYLFIVQRGDQFQVIEHNYLFSLPGDTPVIATFFGLVEETKREEVGRTINEEWQRVRARNEERAADAQEHRA